MPSPPPPHQPGRYASLAYASLAPPAFSLTFLLLSWPAMMAVHELGHVLAALATGGRITEVHLPLLGFSHTTVSPNPHPLLVAWAGPLLGSLLPLLLWLSIHTLHIIRLKPDGERLPRDEPSGFLWRLTLLARFFAGFCLLANGAYLAFGWIDHIGDTGDILRHSGATWPMLLFGAAAMPLGLLLWHRTGPAFGLHSASRASAQF